MYGGGLAGWCGREEPDEDADCAGAEEPEARGAVGGEAVEQGIGDGWGRDGAALGVEPFEGGEFCAVGRADIGEVEDFVLGELVEVGGEEVDGEVVGVLFECVACGAVVVEALRLELSDGAGFVAPELGFGEVVVGGEERGEDEDGEPGDEEEPPRVGREERALPGGIGGGGGFGHTRLVSAGERAGVHFGRDADL